MIRFSVRLTRRLPKDGDRLAKERISKKAKSMMRLRTPRLKKFGKSWWLNRPKEDIENTRSGRTCWSHIYRGRLQRLDTYQSKFSNELENSKTTKQVSVSRMDMSKRQFRGILSVENFKCYQNRQKDFTDFKI